MRRVAVVGGGLSSIGALAFAAETLSAAQDAKESKFEIDYFTNDGPGIEIRSTDGSYFMPKSDIDGFMGRWGAVLALRCIDESAFSCLINLFCNKEVAANVLDTSFAHRFSANGDDIAFLCLARKPVRKVAQQLVASLVKSGVVCRTQCRVSTVTRVQGSWRVLEEGGRNSLIYDSVILCAGVVDTLKILLYSGLYPAEPSYHLKDHVIIFGGFGDAQLANTLFPTNPQLQVITPCRSEFGDYHNVSLPRLIAFGPLGMASLYRSIAGRTTSEILLENPRFAIHAALVAIGSGIAISSSHKNFQITVGDDGFCDVSVTFENDTPIIHWSSAISSSAVSAFHFFGTLTNSTIVSELKHIGLFVGDLSNAEKLNGVNTGTAAFQSGYGAMRDALEADRD